ncbi:putative uncharacterized PH domain-containing protein [Clavispora lusitaniae]|uniref:SMP-LTD domain-containing protein n=2 Tax=Clavispora lusitaniae TaxID=36911 RepID=C4Y4Q1_CLAL4|nr:uncharacterized protein CLUG_02623 [Clavispora lusitaniae ATCC 42720]KAF5211286.1 hypothetical protein E0198_002589 [Clavispora lusitaniae]EEQ38497.1 hypothetical protein CLUG_02623 [Clavispora lusitaniae ATCC 42720]KAF7580112.1 hypothetical protein FOB63_005182 [Clavispora lusitaniae]QFZ27673.1 putative uncharacterized PH domain-containing protein [Clavispora lusitaniae]QFZ33020.1 putative uncharacterized PH domain-containing protein [Clavispora lusitaniae]
MSFVHLIYAYFIGGITFIPFLIFLFIYLHPKQDATAAKTECESLKAGEIEEKAQSGLEAFKQGWITLTHEYSESLDHISSKTQPVTESSEAKSAYASLYKLVKNSSSKSSLPSDTSIIDGTDELDTTALSPVPSGSKPVIKSSGSKKHRYFAVLKHGNLFLYNNEKMKNVKHVIVLSNYIVAIWPRDLSDGALFTKYSSIAILKKDWSRSRRLSENESDLDLEWSNDTKITINDVLDPQSKLPAPPGSFFMYTDVNCDKEDWYFALIRATKLDKPEKSDELNPNIQAKTLHFETKNMVNLIQKLYSSEGQLQVKWFNALIGRLFLSLRGTDFMNQYLVSRVEKKLNKIKMPGFFDKFQIIEVRPGNGAPLLTFPTLKEINPEGDLVVSFYMHYFGGMSIQIATKMNINLGARFKNREVDVLLSMTLEKIQGPMLLKIKEPPSARLWYTFEQEPTMSVKIEPVISSRQMSYNIITNSIEKKLKEAVKESLVLPHWDDMTFYDTKGEVYRGGIWDKEARRSNSSQSGSEVSLDANGDKEGHVHDDVSSIAVSVEDEEHPSARSTALFSGSENGNGRTQKQKLTSTFSDLSKRLRKAKSTHTLSVDETNCLSDGSLERKPDMSTETPDSQYSSLKNSTLKKIGTWYSKDSKPSDLDSSNYTPPQMISNRRQNRKSISTLTSDPDHPVGQMHEPEAFVYDFGSEMKDSGIIPKSLETNIDDRRSASDHYMNPNEVAMLDEEPNVANSLLSTTSSDSPPHRKQGTLHRKPPPDP